MMKPMPAPPAAQRATMLLATLAAAFSVTCLADDSPEIHLPAIYHRIGTASAGPDVTVEEISHCMGLDAELRGRASNVAQSLPEIQEQSHAMEEIQSADRARLHELEVENAALTQAAEQLRKNDEDLSRRKADLEASRPGANADPVTGKDFNARVARFNERVLVVNRERTELQEHFSLSKKHADEYNALVAEHNGTAGRLKERIEKYNSSVSEIQAAYSAHAGACAGERHLKE